MSSHGWTTLMLRLLWNHGWTTLILTTPYGIGRVDFIWKYACCGVMVGQHSYWFCLTTPYGIGRLDFRGKGCCQVEGVLAVESWLDDAHVNNSLWDWESELRRERMLSSSGNACCGVMDGRHSFLLKQLLMGLGGWTSEGKDAV